MMMMNNSDIKYRKMWNICDKYDLEILDYISRDLICFLCEKVIKNAYQNICGCKYCYKCVMKHCLFGVVFCPGNSEECLSQPLTKTAVQIDHALNKKVSKLSVKCPFVDCSFSAELINIETHINDHEFDYSTDLIDNRKDLSLINSFKAVENKLIDLQENSNQFQSFLTEMEYRLAQLYSGESINNDDNNNNNHLKSSTNVMIQNSTSSNNTPNEDDKSVKNLLQIVGDMKLNLSNKSKEIIERTNKATANTVNNEIENNKLEKNIVDICEKENSIKKSSITYKNQEENNNIIDLTEDWDNGESSRKFYDDIVVVSRVSGERKLTRKSPKMDKKEFDVMMKKNHDLRIKCSSRKRKVQLKKSNDLISSFSTQDQTERKNKISHLDINIKNMSPFFWKINNFYKQFNSARLNKITNFDSEKFYSHFGGYRLSLRVYPNGYRTGQGTHLSVFFYLLKGENDESLEWPMKHRVRISLLNQTTNEIYLKKKFYFENCSTSDALAFSKPLNFSNKMVGETHFISLKTLMYDNRILKNDSISFLCTVND